MRVQFGLALERREIIAAKRFLPFFFFVLFVAFVVILYPGCKGTEILGNTLGYLWVISPGRLMPYDFYWRKNLPKKEENVG